MTPWLETAGWTLIHFVWQGCAIAAVTAAALRLAERRSASVRYVIACAGLTLMMAAPIVTARLLQDVARGFSRATIDARPISGDAYARLKARATNARATNARATDARATDADATPVASRQASFDRIVPGITIVWLAGVLLLLARMTGGWWRVRRLHRAAMASTSSRWQTACRRLAYRLGLPAAAHVVESTLVDVPTVVGWLRPAILLPVAALAALSPAQVEAILAHELAHIRRHDYAVNVLQTIAETLLFYHPAVWWLSHRIRAEREHCCDDVAIDLCGDAIAYARALAELETWRTAPATMAMAATGGSLLDRVRRILQVPMADEPRSPSWAVTLALTLLLTAGAGSIQQLPWLTSRSDARAATTGEGTLQAAVAPVDAAPAGANVGAGIGAGAGAGVGVATGIADGIATGIADGVARGIAQGIAGRLSRGVDVDLRFEPAPEPPTPPTPPAPPTPPTPPTPATPPAPPTPTPPPPPTPPPASSRNGKWRMQWNDGGTRVDVTLHGTIAFTEDLTDVQSLSDGGYLKIRDWSHVIPHTIEIGSSGGSLTHTYYVSGIARPWDEDARRWLATGLPALVRQSGLAAESRVKQIVEKKGVNGVLAEIALITGDYARRLYLVALVDAAHLDAGSVQRVLAEVGQRMTSDYDRREVLVSVAAHVKLDARSVSAYAQAMASMTSDYDQRQALAALLKTGAVAVDSDAVVAMIAHIKSSYDKRMVVMEAIQAGPSAAAAKKGLLTASAGIQSDYDRGQVLTAFAQKFGVEPDVREPFFTAVRSMGSDYERRRILTEIAKSRTVAGDVLRSALDSTSAMSSDYDRAETLLALLRGHTLTPASRQAFVAAADRIKSSHDQDRVLAALVRSEQR